MTTKKHCANNIDNIISSIKKRIMIYFKKEYFQQNVDSYMVGGKKSQ